MMMILDEDGSVHLYVYSNSERFTGNVEKNITMLY